MSEKDRERARNTRKRMRQVRVKRQKMILALVAVAALFVIYFAVAASYRRRFLPHARVNGLAVGGMTAEKAEAVLAENAESYVLNIIFQEGNTETVPASSFSLKYVPQDEAAKAIAGQNIFSWPGRIFSGKNYTLETEVTYDQDELKTAIENLPEFQSENITAPVNAYEKLNDDGTAFEIVPEVTGNEPDTDTVFSHACSAVEAGEGTLDLREIDGAYVRPTVTSGTKELVDAVASLNNFISTNIEIELSVKRRPIRLSKSTLISWLTENDDSSYKYLIDTDNIWDSCASYVEEIAEKYDKVQNTLSFASTNLGTVTVPCASYGFEIDTDTATDDFYTAVTGAKDGLITFASDVPAGRNPKGSGTYIEVDIPNQHLYFYKNHSLFFDTECVTGLESDPTMATPSGVFAVYLMQEDRDLKGNPTAAAPEGYSSHVDHWMAFYESYGMHDASWRDEFGGTYYAWAGSHGCVNLPIPAAKTIYDNLEIDTPVVVVRAEGVTDPSTYKDEYEGAQTDVENAKKAVETANAGTDDAAKASAAQKLAEANEVMAVLQEKIDRLVADESGVDYDSVHEVHAG